MTKTNNVFSVKNFRLVFLGSFVSEIGSVLYNFAVSFYILEITENNAFLQGLFLALGSGALLLMTPVGGVFGDRFNKAKIMVICDWLKGGMIILATVLMLLLNDRQSHIVILFTLGILSNMVSGFFSPASAALLPEIIEPEQFQQANSYVTIKSSFNSIFGVVLAGVLYAIMPIHVLFVAVGLAYIASGISEMFVKYDYKAPENVMTLKTVFSDMKDGLIYIKGQKAILAFMSAILFINFFFTPVTGNFMPYFIKTDLTSVSTYLFDSIISPEMWSSIFSVLIAVFSLISAAVMSTKRDEGKVGSKVANRLLMLGIVMVVVSLGYRLLVSNHYSINAFLIVLCGFSIAIGALLPMINIPISTAILKVIDTGMLSKVMGLINVLSQGLVPVASVLAGVILQKGGILPLLIFCSAGFMLTAVYMLLNRSVKEI